MVTAELVKQLRERTGVGLAKCKSALDESNGDIEKAIEALRKAGVASAVKKEARVTKEGRVEYFETPETLAVIEMNAETWLALVHGEKSWADALGEGLINASGARADLSALLPLQNRISS